MRRFFFGFFFFILLTIFYFLLTTAAKAAGEFSISYDNIYEVGPNSNLAVTQNVKITNLTTQYYAAEFAISVGNVKIENAQASDGIEKIPTTVNFDNNKTLIKLKFATPVVGRGQTKNFTLSYTTGELVNKAGQILEVSIPKLADASDINQFNVTLIVPAGLGPVAFITPEPVSSEISGFGGVDKYFFNKTQLTKSGVTAAFGEKQIFSFTLTYHLQNSKSAQTEIALPPDNPYQKIIIEKVEPKPKDVRVDKDGNWLALYELDAGKPIDVKVSGFAEIYPRPKFKTSKFQNNSEYLTAQKYWEVGNDYFTQKAKELKTPKQIYDFVISFLSYNEGKLTEGPIERAGGLAAVENPANAVCMEFTDLFITLARAARIPAREVNGFAASSNERLKPLSLRNFGGDILHAWPEYWDETLQTWVQVDPTWGSTSGGLDYFSKMDFNHVSFVHKGQSSTYPVPAGGYKIDPNQSGDVKVEFAKSLPAATFNPKLSIEFPQNLLSPIDAKGKVKVSNLSNQAISSDPLKFQTKNLTLKTPSEVNLGILPPKAAREVEFEVATAGLLANEKGEIAVSFGELTEVLNVQIRPSLIILSVGALFGIVFLVVFSFGSFFLVKKIVKKP